MDTAVMADINVDISKLPEDIREKLAELDLELSEGESKNLIQFRTGFNCICFNQ